MSAIPAILTLTAIAARAAILRVLFNEHGLQMPLLADNHTVLQN